MSKDEIKAEITKVLEEIDAHTQKVQTKEYETDAELNRDIAIASELCQKYVDLLGEASDFIHENGVEE